MMNKLSEDEAIKILKKITPDDLLNCWEGGEKEFEAIETILDLYQQEKKKNEKLVDKTIQYDKTLEKLQKDTIWKDKIKAKIKLLEEKIHVVIPNEYNKIEVMNELKNEGAVDVLKELLERR